MIIPDLIYKINSEPEGVYVSLTNTSLTGDASKWLTRVVETLRRQESIFYSRHKFAIVYMDSTGFWDGFDLTTGKIILLGSEDHKQAFYQFLRKTT